MKKLHILIPSLVATISMPLVSMVGCNKLDEPHYDLEVKMTLQERETMQYISEYLTCEKDKTYKVCLDFKDNPDLSDHYQFMIDKTSGIYFELDCDYIIQVGNTRFNKLSSPDPTQFDVWWDDTEAEQPNTMIHVNNKKTHKTKMNFYITFHEKCENICFFADVYWQETFN